MKYDLGKYNNIINDWFYNVSKNIVNDEILFLKEEQRSLVDTIVKAVQENNSKCIVMDVFNYIYNYDRLENTNYILYKFDNIDITKLLQSQSFLEKKLLFVPHNNIAQYINTVNNNQQGISNEERFLYYVEKVNPLNIIKLNHIEIESFINFSVNKFFLIQNNYDGFNLLLNKTSYKRESFDKSLISDIGNLKEHKILPARLAVIIYRIANLNLHASVTEVGRYFHKQLGSKSKTYNYNLIQKYNNTATLYVDDDLKGKNFKAYNLTVNESEIIIRKVIAKKLIGFLDIQKIAEVTKISSKDIEKM